LTVSLRVGDQVLDARVISFDGNAASNALQKFGLSFQALNVLHEQGLIIPDYNSYMDYRPCIAVNRSVAAPFIYLNKPWGLAGTNALTAITDAPELRLHGVALSRSGVELLSIVDPEPDDSYTSALQTFLTSRGYTMVPVRV
jgi:hypothetical protein